MHFEHIDEGKIIRIKDKQGKRRFDVAVYKNGGIVILSDLYSHKRNGLTFKHGMKCTVEKFVSKYTKYLQNKGDNLGTYVMLQRTSTSEGDSLKSYHPFLSPT